jgi:hypothetical protein
VLSCVAPFGEFARLLGGEDYRGLRTNRYTYVRDLAGPWLLFDKERDPFQRDKLAGRLAVGFVARAEYAAGQKAPRARR